MWGTGMSYVALISRPGLVYDLLYVMYDMYSGLMWCVGYVMSCLVLSRLVSCRP